MCPYARGNNRSVPADPNILTADSRNCLKQGFEEICLTGVDACSYQRGTPSFSSLVQHNSRRHFPNCRLYSSARWILPRIDGNFIALVGKIFQHSPAFSPFRSIRRQYDVLKWMHRRHTREERYQPLRTNHVKSVLKQHSAPISSAVFRPKRDEQFQNTVNLGPRSWHKQTACFPYSERSGTRPQP
ncbi:MAG: hypothetical protein ACLU99_11350 [Alphaproteobacteria bacterium]